MNVSAWWYPTSPARTSSGPDPSNDTDVDIHKQHLQLSICHVHSRSRIFRTVWSSTESHLCPLTLKLQIIGVNDLLNVSSSLYQRKMSLCKLLLHIVLQINCPGHYVPWMSPLEMNRCWAQVNSSLWMAMVCIVAEFNCTVNSTHLNNESDFFQLVKAKDVSLTSSSNNIVDFLRVEIHIIVSPRSYPWNMSQNHQSEADDFCCTGGMCYEDPPVIT